jgi:hypothetical protein
MKRGGSSSLNTKNFMFMFMELKKKNLFFMNKNQLGAEPVWFGKHLQW